MKLSDRMRQEVFYITDSVSRVNATVDRWADEVALLEAVARAAKACDDTGLIRSVPWTMGTWDGPYPRGELLAALAAVEDLVEGGELA